MPSDGAAFVGTNEATADLLLVAQPPAPSPPQAPAQRALQAAPPAASGPGATAPPATAPAPAARGRPTPATPTQPGPLMASDSSAAASTGQALLTSPSAAASQVPAGTAAASRPPLPNKTPSPGADADTVFWQSIMASKDRNEFVLYLQKFPHGHFAELAKERINILASSQLPSADPREASERQTLISPLLHRTHHATAAREPSRLRASQSYPEVNTNSDVESDTAPFRAAAERSTLSQADVNAPLQVAQRTRLPPATARTNPTQGRVVAPGFTEGANRCMRNNYNGPDRGPC